MCRSKPFSLEILAIVRGPSVVDVTASSVSEGTSPIWGDRYLLEHNCGHLMQIHRTNLAHTDIRNWKIMPKYRRDMQICGVEQPVLDDWLNSHCWRSRTAQTTPMPQAAISHQLP